MGDYATFAAFVTHDDIARVSSQTAAPRSNSLAGESAAMRAFQETREHGYDYVCVPLTRPAWHERWKRMCVENAGDVDGGGEGDRGGFKEEEWEGEGEREAEGEKEKARRDQHAAVEAEAEMWRKQPHFLHDEVTMTRLDEAEGVIGVVSDWLTLDSSDDWVRHDSEIALHQEIAYASYLNIQTVVLPPPRNREHVASYARAVNECLKRVSYMKFSVQLPIYDPAAFQQKETPRLRSGSTVTLASTLSETPPSTPRLLIPGNDFPLRPKKTRASERELNATWEMWDVIRSVCDYSPRLTLTLDLAPPLPLNPTLLGRWSAEPVQNVLLPTSTFIANAKGYPVLPKGTQTFLKDNMKHRPTVLLSGTKLGLHGKGGEAAYAQYVRHLEKTSPIAQASRKAGSVENFAQGYQDFLQAPLQPLMDNLQSATYETFEQCPVKYINYEEAICRALLDWPESDRIVICVAGAGRGPLVARSLKAIERSRRTAHIIAVEKNPNAYVTLQDRQRREWGASVQLVYGDMRQITVPEQADILVSELLGSFGDNELSPECLDGAMRFLKPDGISIPSSYTAHLAPLSSTKLYNEARQGGELKSLETPYVVMFQNVNVLSGNGGGLRGKCGPAIQECWTFEHPRKDATLDERGLPPTNSHNIRAANLSFYIPHAGILHGLAGYFEAVLYGNIGLSIHPQRKDQISKDMLSWFPLFFPFKEPLYLPSNSELQVSIWRLTNERQVWYEWYAESFLPVLNVAPRAGDPVLETVSASASTASFFASPTTHVAVPSPLIDAIDPASPPFFVREDEEAAKYGAVKVGQSALHNAGGRSSWIGL
ncbi:PRMT5-domain-containing protein [Coniophora puteana RWD-64-598 SS2]|uniref:Protein arginine N-methyltransferase n=1 Tax=Coniophora puteana (strain RWD-64-598) TaxID=741705 RepID=A0A5M3MY59_CONPW|nr:PRMT5-domain-containing protein [Coniophora puteana RWD-64-598 SS2]EIW83976.1 PRMT5-domain-containing protein [Coniophora puteana RWD-64-598 SS2]